MSFELILCSGLTFKGAGWDLAVEDDGHGAGMVGNRSGHGDQEPKLKTRMAIGMEMKPSQMNRL